MDDRQVTASDGPSSAVHGGSLTDPDEVLEVYDPHGRPTGLAKRRGEIHCDGDWHLAFFCWIVRGGPRGAELVLQKRSSLKDVWPERFDASAAGHVHFGETRGAALREVAEELGLAIAEADLAPLPRHRQEHRHPNGIVDREHHDLNLVRCDLPFEAYRPNPAEVAGLVALAADDLADLAEGRRASIDTELVKFDAAWRAQRSPLRLRRTDLVPYDVGYHRGLAREAARLVLGGTTR
jgi:isopentenyldiphosphate isomerase